MASQQLLLVLMQLSQLKELCSPPGSAAFPAVAAAAAL
jgi:hypothetical protein